jgi:hypothetical protein
MLTEFGLPKKIARFIKMCMHDLSSTVPKGKPLSDASLVYNGPKLGDPIIFLILFLYV